MNEITIYSKVGCAFCERLVQILKIKEIEFTELKLDKDFNTDKFLAEFGPGATFPQVKYGNKNIGGMKESVRYLIEHNLL
jgi:glutaredoxin